MENGEDDIPTVYGLDKPITWQYALAMVSSIVWLILCAMPSAVFLMRLKYPGNVYDVTSWLYLLLMSVSAIVGVLIGKYGWLYLMSFVVGKADVGPIVAFNRKISRFDRRFIHKHFRR